MEIAFILSLEHETLPLAELKAVLKAEKVPYSIKNRFKGLIVIDIPDEYLAKDLSKNILNRLSFTHEVFQVLLTCEEEKLTQEVQKYAWKEIINDEFAVRIKKRGKSSTNTLELEKKIGSIINEQTEYKYSVNLEKPSVLIRIVLLNGKVFLGKTILKISKKHFYDLKPHKRPFFYPGSMSPKLARCMVNLTMIRSKEKLLDPFCGTGGILIEAGVIGAQVVGTDIDPKMVKGTRENLEHCHINNSMVFQADVRTLKLPYKIDAVATDPPYGISASTRGEESHKLCGEALLSLENVIKEGGRICMATPHYMEIKEFLKGTKFKIIEQHHIRMHKSLTRVISVMVKT
jgi:tRNA (guanine10-N2)-dimethyltransferase